MADGGNALAAELRLDQVALNVRQRVQLRRLLGEYQREGYEQVSQSTVHVTAEPGHSVLLRTCGTATPRRASASARGGTGLRRTASRWDERSAGRCRWARRFPRNSRN